MRQVIYTWFYIGGSRLDQTDNFQKFYRTGLDRIQFYQTRTVLGRKNFTVRSSLTIGWSYHVTSVIRTRRQRLWFRIEVRGGLQFTQTNQKPLMYLASTETMATLVLWTKPLQISLSSEKVMCFELVMWSFQTICLSVGEKVPAQCCCFKCQNRHCQHTLS